MTTSEHSPPLNSDAMELDEWTSLREASLANRLAELVNGLALPTNAGSGLTHSAWLENLCRHGYASRTQPSQGYSQLAMDGSSTPLRIRWPRWGIRSGGQCIALRTWERHTSVIGSSSSGARSTPRATATRGSRRSLVLNKQWSPPSLEQQAELSMGVVPREYHSINELTPAARQTYDAGLWPTPVADGDRTTNYAQGGHSLGAAARLWPTPNASQGQQGENDPDGKRGQTLVGAARGQLWPTPTASEQENRTTKRTPSQQARKHGFYLSAEVHEAQEQAMWPSPRATDAAKGGPNQRGSKGDLMPPSAAAQAQVSPRATPKASDSERGDCPSERQRRSPGLKTEAAMQTTAPGGGLNPAWDAILMGLPQDYLRRATLYYTRAGRRVKAPTSTTGSRRALRTVSPTEPRK